MSSTVLPPTWTVQTAVEVVPNPNVGTPAEGAFFARQTTYVRNSLGLLVAASGDRDDAVNQALGICQATDVPYDSATWGHA